MNLSDEYLGEASDTNRWDDILYYHEGPAVFGFYQIFHNDWNYATGVDEPLQLDYSLNDTTTTGENIVQVVPLGEWH